MSQISRLIISIKHEREEETISSGALPLTPINSVK